MKDLLFKITLFSPPQRWNSSLEEDPRDELFLDLVDHQSSEIEDKKKAAHVGAGCQDWAGSESGICLETLQDERDDASEKN